MFFFFNDTATTEIYTLSLHDALPIFGTHRGDHPGLRCDGHVAGVHRTAVLHPGAHERGLRADQRDRKSTRLNSSHANISYAVFCLKKKNHMTSKTMQFSLQISFMSHD